MNYLGFVAKGHVYMAFTFDDCDLLAVNTTIAEGKIIINTNYHSMEASMTNHQRRTRFPVVWPLIASPSMENPPFLTLAQGKTPRISKYVSRVYVTLNVTSVWLSSDASGRILS